MIKRLVLYSLKIYQRFISPWTRNCRYCPSCSDYAVEAFKKYPTRRALFLVLRRLGRCHPFSSKPIYDPVP